MNLNTPPLRPRHSASSSSSEATPSTPTRQFPPSTRRAFAAPPGSGLRDAGTPVGRLLRQEGVTARTPRKVRTRNWTQRVRDWPSNLLLSLETSWEDLSFDSAGYPIGISFHTLHFLTRLPRFASALPSWLQFGQTQSKYLAAVSDLTDADARLRALQQQAHGTNFTWTRMGTLVSLLLVLVSTANAAYLFTRRRRYHLVLRRDPLASPNARSTTLDFSNTGYKLSVMDRIKHSLQSLMSKSETSEKQNFQIQQLDVWTPENVKYSQRIFIIYSPPIAILYHFLSLSNLLPFVICGAAFIFQTFILTQMFTHLLADRSTLSSELMHEYQARYVNPRLNVYKKDVGTSTLDLEFSEWREGHARDSEPKASERKRRESRKFLLGDEELEETVRGSGRKVRKSSALGT